MSVFDLRQRCLLVNDAACKVMGVDEAALSGRFFSDTVPGTESDRGFLRHLREVSATGRPVRYENFARAPALNREHLWSIEMWPLRAASGRLAGVAIAAFDNTEQYWARLGGTAAARHLITGVAGLPRSRGNTTGLTRHATRAP
jgi:PAS domain-containing protein